MKKIKFGTGSAVFIIFFGIALIEAFRDFNLLEIIFWISAGILFLLADNINNRKTKQT